MPRKSAQDKAFDKALRLLPALSNDDLAVIVVACNNIVSAREKAKRRALTPRVAPTIEEASRDALATGDGNFDLPAQGHLVPIGQRDETQESSDVPT